MSREIRLIRRNGSVVPFDPNKIEVAVRKAFMARDQESSPAVDIANAVTNTFIDASEAFVRIEEVQDQVQEELMRRGFYKVAEEFILYRALAAANRDANRSSEPSGDTPDLEVTIDNGVEGDTEVWNPQELLARVNFARVGLDLSLSVEEIVAELRRSFYSKMTRKAIQSTIVLNAKSMLEKDADFAKFAGRILLTYIYEEVLGWDILKDGPAALKDFHRKQFVKYIKQGIKLKRLNPALKEYNLSKLARRLDPSADLDFDFLGIQTLYDRYLLIDKSEDKDRRIETPQFFWMRVAMGLFLNAGEEKETKVERLYNMYKSRRFCSSTPTLFNSGTMHSQLSSCFLFHVQDSIQSIMERGIAENAYLSKWAGGLGGSWTAVRGTGSHINGTNGDSQGVVPFLKLFNDMLLAVDQGGKRRGSGCAYLETWHNDIEDFLELRRNTGDDRRRTHDMNTANWIPDLFMKRMEAREDWTLFRSSETPDLHELYGKKFETRYVEYEKMAAEGKIFGKSIPALELWKKMLRVIFETAMPWMTFKDPCNIRSPQQHAGVIHSSNLCTEITLNTGEDETAVCNLGSIVLDSHLREDGSLDTQMLQETVEVAVEALDAVIDLNFYPTQAAKNANTRHRPIGLGVMGLQYCLYKKDISFASDEAVEFNDEVMELVAYNAYLASSKLAAKYGTYQSYKGSLWSKGVLPQDTLDMLEEERGVELPRVGTSRLDWTPVREHIKKHGMRNSNVLAIAPTATISNIMGTSPCIEPSYKNLFVKSNLSGDFIVLNPYLVRDLKRLGLWNQAMIDDLKYFDGDLGAITSIPVELKRKYLTAFDIEYMYFIRAAAARQKWIDQSQSVNLFLRTPSIKTLSHMYRAAWRYGLKTTYYLRTLSASNIEKATVAARKRPEDSAMSEEASRLACSIEAMRNGEECEACQ